MDEQEKSVHIEGEQSPQYIIGDWKFDAFITDSGDLGFTVEPADQSSDSDHFRDIFVHKGNLKITSI